MRMLVMFLAVTAVLVKNGDSTCIVDFQNAMQVCTNKMQDATKEASELSSTDAQNQKMCCAFKEFESCAVDAGKKCGRTTEDLMKQAVEARRSTLKASCSECSGGNSVVPANAVAVYLLLFLGYCLYANKF